MDCVTFQTGISKQSLKGVGQILNILDWTNNTKRADFYWISIGSNLYGSNALKLEGNWDK